jgi:hypothetical protein
MPPQALEQPPDTGLLFKKTDGIKVEHKTIEEGF